MKRPARPAQRRLDASRWPIMLITTTLAMISPALADCEAGIAALTAQIAGVTDPHLHALVEIDLRRAQFELWEFDEVECAVALQHAARLIRFGA
jgi:hypothetical protein